MGTIGDGLGGCQDVRGERDASAQDGDVPAVDDVVDEVEADGLVAGEGQAGAERQGELALGDAVFGEGGQDVFGRR